jgi:CRP/FNR family transcriptional regulator, cyclic AMP receptor protein
MKKNGLPSSLTEYNSLRNPLINAFVTMKIAADESHLMQRGAAVDLSHKSEGCMIDHSVLQHYGAKKIALQKDEVLFREGEEALNYFQVADGSVKMITNTTEGQEFIQGIFNTHDSFGEPPLLCSFPYPSTAVALESSLVLKLSKENFLRLLRENFEIHLQMDKALCERLRYKAMVLTEISFYDPAHRIDSLLQYFKHESLRREQPGINRDSNYVIPFTRQQLADMTGLRVETVIRTVKKMEDEGKLKLVGRKITV